MILLIIRHGQSEADILNVIEGRANFNLTDLGRKQAALMAEWVAQKYTLGNTDLIDSSQNFVIKMTLRSRFSTGKPAVCCANARRSLFL